MALQWIHPEDRSSVHQAPLIWSYSTAILGSSNNVVFVGVNMMGIRERMRQLHGRLDLDSGQWETSATATLPVSSVAIGVE